PWWPPPSRRPRSSPSSRWRAVRTESGPGSPASDDVSTRPAAAFSSRLVLLFLCVCERFRPIGASDVRIRKVHFFVRLQVSGRHKKAGLWPAFLSCISLILNNFYFKGHIDPYFDPH